VSAVELTIWLDGDGDYWLVDGAGLTVFFWSPVSRRPDWGRIHPDPIAAVKVTFGAVQMRTLPVDAPALPDGYVLADPDGGAS
jgi:hypothetical protein